MGERIAQRRKQLGLSQEELADEVGVNRSQVSMWENDRATPGGANMVELARVLRRTPAWIMDADDGGAPTSTGKRQAAIREEQPDYRVVPLDEAGLPLSDELEQLRDWIPEGMTRRMSRQVTDRVWLGELYAFGIEQGWPAERLDRIDSARRRVDALQRRDGQE